MVDVYNRAMHVNPREGEGFSADVQMELCDEPLKVVKACRSTLARGFLDESRGGIQPLGKRFSIAVVSCQVSSSLLVRFPTVVVLRLARFSLLSEVGAIAAT
jgi:hypothetical protein